MFSLNFRLIFDESLMTTQSASGLACTVTEKIRASFNDRYFWSTWNVGQEFFCKMFLLIIKLVTDEIKIEVSEYTTTMNYNTKIN